MKKQSAYIALWLALIAGMTLPLQTLPAQDMQPPPSPKDVPGVDDADLPPWTQPTPRKSRTHYGTMSGWDLYAGSVYANTSPIWVQAEGLLWWIEGNPVPALVTTSPNGTPRELAGVLGAPGTSTLFGDEQVDDEVRGGFRTALGVRLGHWFDNLMDSELEFGVLWLGDGQTSGDFYTASLGDPILARPFYNVELGAQDSQLVALPQVVLGDILIETSSDFVSAGVLFRKGWLRGEHARIDWLAGYRYAQLQEELYVSENLISTDLAGPVAAGTTFDLLDRFATWNEFHGADLGLQLWTHAHGWTVEVLGKIAIGSVARTIEINGETLTITPDNTDSFSSGGLLAMPTNMGRHQSCRFSAMPELTIRLRRPLSRFFTLSLGYTVMAVDHVVRTGDQLDLTVNPTQFGNGALVGLPRPTVLMSDSTLLVHGFTIGLEW